MANLPFIPGDWQRKVAREARLETRNRYYEENPVLNNVGAGLLARPGLKRFTSVGTGPIRGVFSVYGTFGNALFVVSGSEWYIVQPDGSSALILSGIAGGQSPVEMAGTGNIGDLSEIMYLADGANLWAYMLSAYARAVLSGTPANGDVVKVGTVYYQFTTGSVDAGTPAGTLANPWLVVVGGTPAVSYTNLAGAIGADGDAGAEYSTALLVPNPDARGYEITPTSLTVQALAIGTGGNSISISETGGLTFAPSTTNLSGGGAPSAFKIPTPDNFGTISIAVIASFVVVVPAQGQGINGRYYWIEPGEVTINADNFATAERAPDPISGVKVFGDQFWLPGTTTTEAWYFTGDLDVPTQRQQGLVFDWGAYGGTAVQVKSSMIIVDASGGVFMVSGGIERISNPGIAERIRNAIGEAP